MADDDFADFESAQSTNTDQKEPQMIPSFTAFEIPPLDFDDDFNQDFTTPPPLSSSSSKLSTTGAPGDLFSLPPPLSALTDSIPPSLDPLPPSLDLDQLPSFADIPPPLPPVGASNDFTPLASATSTSQFVADFSSSTEVNIASSPAGNEVSTEGESVVNKIDDSFGSFNEVPATATGNENPTSNGIGDDDFANFASFSEAQFPPPPLASSDADPPVEGDGFSNFASFSDPPAALTSNTNAPLQQVPSSDDDGFSNFASFSDAAAVPEATPDEPKATPPVSEAPSTVPDSDDFDEFTSFSDNTVSQSLTSTAPPPLPPEDDFGDFGSFDSVPVAPPPAVAPPPKATAPPINNKEALAACFPSQSLNKVSDNNIKTIKDCLSSDEISNRVWSQLNDKAECTRFFFQWSTSFLKDRFYTAVRVDPMLAPAVGSKGTGLLGDIGPLPETGGGAMMIDTGSFDETPGTTLLDLSLPLSPSANEEAPGVSFDDFIGLSLNASDEGTQEQSKETTPTLWMDSELLELESESQPVPLTTPSSTTTDWLSRLTQTATSLPSTTREEDIETEQKLVETKSSVYELLVSEGSSDMGWSFTMNTTGSNEMSEPVIGKPSNSNTAIEPNTFMNNNETLGVVQELSDPQGFSKQPALVNTGPLDNIGSFFENPLSFPVVAPPANQPLVPLTVSNKQEEGSLDKGAAAATGDVNQQRAISLIKKLPQLDFMLSDKLMF
ncbi:PREDICTED: cell wall protein RBR3-like [Amphimedon queenslandica]|uniref:Uncharacterized protein n=1 Tax=Amphimedon queenslandica TaxID=400682 RepID=A0A1X7VDI4_AMPQE|nr:PREDICTED: cell wall protein RBR3-like [Amphimedon queenslandica]|eukprot:XP_011410505.1 PREDICTED: cell wall protein RBR3-like [Amphimedon queenslandica]